MTMKEQQSYRGPLKGGNVQEPLLSSMGSPWSPLGSLPSHFVDLYHYYRSYSGKESISELPEVFERSIKGWKCSGTIGIISGESQESTRIITKSFKPLL